VHHIWPNAIKHFQLHNNIRIDSTEDAVKIISELSNHKASVIADVEKIPLCPTLKKIKSYHSFCFSNNFIFGTDSSMQTTKLRCKGICD